jgi:hypothetical protein
MDEQDEFGPVVRALPTAFRERAIAWYLDLYRKHYPNRWSEAELRELAIGDVAMQFASGITTPLMLEWQLYIEEHPSANYPLTSEALPSTEEEFGPAVRALAPELRERAIGEAEAFCLAEYPGRTDEQYPRLAIADVGMQLSGGVDNALIVEQEHHRRDPGV